MNISEQTTTYEIVSPPLEAIPDTFPYYGDLTVYTDEYKGMTITVLSIVVYKVSAKLHN